MNKTYDLDLAHQFSCIETCPRARQKPPKDTTAISCIGRRFRHLSRTPHPIFNKPKGIISASLELSLPAKIVSFRGDLPGCIAESQDCAEMRSNQGRSLLWGGGGGGSSKLGGYGSQAKWRLDGNIICNLKWEEGDYYL
jgi:hypothetical protein